MLFLRCTLSLYTTHFLSTLLENYTRIILDRMDSLQEVSKVLIADAYFSKRGFVESLFQNGFTVISRLRDDADLQYLYKGKQNKGRGRPRKYDGKVLVRALDPDKVTLENEQEREQIYSVVVASKSLKMNIKVVIVKTKTKDRWSHKLYFSTDIEMDWKVILDYYRSRFQIEFLYRDSKQFTGM